jgi:hypothetical protein
MQISQKQKNGNGLQSSKLYQFRMDTIIYSQSAATKKSYCDTRVTKTSCINRYCRSVITTQAMPRK